MPVRAPRICTCGKVVPSGARCACRRDAARAHDAKRGTAASRGYDSRWRRESRAFLAEPGNERCACGCGRVATMVDHRVAPKGDDRLFWDRRNWQAFNVACNSRKNIASEGGFGRAIPASAALGDPSSQSRQPSAQATGGAGRDFRGRDQDRLGSIARHQPEFEPREKSS